MPQLRDAKTSALIAEGTPLELVTIADELGLNAGVVGIGETGADLDAIFDDVGLGFDPDAVRRGRDEELAGLKAASSKRATPDDDVREAVIANRERLEGELDEARGRAPDALAELEAARNAAGV